VITGNSSPPAAVVSDADTAMALTSPSLPDGPAMVKMIDYSKYMMYVGIIYSNRAVRI